MYRIEFYSGADESTGAAGYDGSMSRQEFQPADLPGMAASLDCVYGPCFAIVTRRTVNPLTGNDMVTRDLYPFQRTVD